jgi:predicted permease
MLRPGLSLDMRYAVRMLAAHRVVSLVAIASLALGIGANTAIFSLINAVLLRELPVKEPGRLVMLSDPERSGVMIGSQTGVRSLFTYAEFEQMRAGATVFSGLFASESQAPRASIRVDGEAAEEVTTRLVSGSYFETLGVRPLLGRAFTAEEDRAPGAAPYAVLSYDFWRNRFHRDPAVLGRAVAIGSARLTVIGVLPAGFFGETVGESPALYIPITMEPMVKPGRDWLHDDPARAEKVMWLHVTGRLKPGVSMEQAQANASVVFGQYLRSLAGANPSPERRKEILDQRLQARPGGKGASTMRGDAAEPLLVLMGMVGVVLLIACANVANLLLARTVARRREIGVRLALGAGRLAILRPVLLESLLLSLLGGALGLLISHWGTRVLLRILSQNADSLALEAAPDWRVFLFTAAVSAGTGIAFGVIPAWRASRYDAQQALAESGRGLTGSVRRVAAGKLLVVAQVALSLLLLIGAGLFMRTLENLRAVDLGYPRDRLIVARVDALEAGYRGPAAGEFYRRLMERFRAIPGVRTVTMSENGLFSGTESADQITAEGYTPKKKGDDSARFDQVGPNYFSGLGIPILLGREIGPQDQEGAPRVCVINESLARFFFGKRNPIGRHLTDEFPDTRATFEIVGVVRDSRDHRIRGEVPRRFFIPAYQGLGGLPPSAYFEIRTFADPGVIMNEVRRTGVALRSMRTLDALVEGNLRSERVVAQLAAAFGGAALLLASLGLYGVLSYGIARRTNEIGIRMALGASRAGVVGMVLRETSWLLAAGAAVGIPCALAASRIISSRLFGVQAADPLTLAAATALLAAVGLLAGLLPARRAAAIDPLRALHYE